MNVLHLTPHMGGGVGRALLGVASNVNNGIEHSFICLEKPEKKQFLEAIRELGCKVLVAPSRTKIIEQIEASDIVQLEWWRHPATIECLSHLSSISMRLVVWCHVSGLYNEIIPEQLLKSSARFLLTSACSLQSTQIQRLSSEEKERLAIVHSNGGLEAWPMSSACDEHEPLAVGYIGSLNFAKLHPNYVDFLASVAIDDFKISLIGDLTNQDVLQHQAISLNKPKLLNFVGYVEDVPTALSKINVLAYLQNPTHYGTNENALLEAMAMGIVPVVLNNPAECEIVEHGVTGLVVDSIEGFSEAIGWLHQHPQQRTKLGLQAAKAVKERHTKNTMKNLFSEHYHAVMQHPKHAVNFNKIFGEQPVDWFLSCQEDKTVFASDGGINYPDNRYLHYGLKEETKGSAIHFHRYFSDDRRLSQWARQLAS